MKKFIVSACLVLFALSAAASAAAASAAAASAAAASAAAASAAAASPAAKAQTRKQVNAFIDEWHDDAAHARLAYFDKMASDGIYIGTDKTELWTRDQFKAWAKRFFERKSAWAFKATSRNIYMSDDAKFIWFDELLDTQMGVCQASGVIQKTDKGYEIKHYQLSMAVPNDVGASVTRLIREHESRAADKK